MAIAKLRPAASSSEWKAGEDYPDNTTKRDIVGVLTPATHYRLGSLAYSNTSDSPRSIHLTVATLGEVQEIHV